MASLCLTSPSSPSSSSSPLPSPLSWVSQLFLQHEKDDHEKEITQIYEKKLKGSHENNLNEEKIIRQKNFEAFQKSLHENLYMKKESYLSVGNLIGESSSSSKGCEGVSKVKKRPARLVVPQYCPKLEFIQNEKKMENKEFEVQGKDFFLASKKGRREAMEDCYGVMFDVLGDLKQAFFTVIDGHGGCAAAEFVAENLGKNIVKCYKNDYQIEEAIRAGYLITDKEFLSKGVSSGACAASVLLKDGELYVANVGDCRVVLSRNGLADTLTTDHRVSREDERLRIEISGGFVHCCNGIWRVQGSLAISRAIGDSHLKEWIISEPEIQRIALTSDCQFLILASDGLWDKVDEQEAVDIVSRGKNSVETCKQLIDLSFSRGNLDDITVMLINLQDFTAKSFELLA